MSPQFVYQYLYRGFPSTGFGSGVPECSVVLGQYFKMPGMSEPDLLQTDPLTPEQAAAAGFPLSAIIDGINEAALVDRDAQAAALVAMTAERDRLAAQIADLAPAPASGATISDRQFFQALALAGDITQDEALAAVMTGTLPAKIQAAVDALPDEGRFAARMLLSGATTFDRAHPMVAVLGTILGKDAAALDALWASAAAL